MVSSLAVCGFKSYPMQYQHSLSRKSLRNTEQCHATYGKFLGWEVASAVDGKQCDEDNELDTAAGAEDLNCRMKANILSHLSLTAEPIFLQTKSL